MEYVTILQLYQTQLGIENELWGFFSVAAFAVLGFTVGSERATQSPTMTVIIVAGFLIFTQGNLRVIEETHRVAVALAEAAADAAPAEGPLAGSVPAPYPVRSVTAFHWLLRGLVVIAIVAVYLVRRRQAARAAPGAG